MKAKEKAEKLYSPQFTIRKISSEDDVSGLPRSHCTSQIVSGYADSIRRQRSDSFVHSYNHQKAFRTRTVHKPLQVDLDDDDGDGELDMNENHDSIPNSNKSSGSVLPSIKTTTKIGNYQARNSRTTSPNSIAASSMKSSLHINTNPATTINKSETGAILEGVLIRRAVRPGSPLIATLSSPQNPTLNESDTLSRFPRIATTALTPTSETSMSPTPTTTATTPSTPSAPWLPPSLTTPQHSNITISSLSSGTYDENPEGVKPLPDVSKLQLKSEKTVDDQSNKHPSLFKRLAQFHHSSGSRSYHDEQLHEFMKSSPSHTAAILDQDTELDRYGFQKTTQWITLDIYHDFEKYYQPILDRRLLRWQQMLSENESKLPDRCTQVKRYIRKGIPSQLRGSVWFHYSGAKAKMGANPGVYDKFLIRAQGMGDDNEFADLIERDLHRTFPDNIQFSKAATALLSASSPSNDGPPSYVTTKSPPAIDVLRRVLSAFSVYCPSVGYCQSLNYLVGMLLLFYKEEEAFWCISTIAQTILPAGVYDVTMEGASIDQAVLMMLLYERMPQLWYKLTDKTFWEAESDGVSMPTITLVTSHWFLTLFINILPTETVLRVWDCFFYEGSSILFRIALTLFKMSEPIIYGLDDPLEIFQVIQNFPKRIIDCQALMEYAFRRYGTLSGVSNDDLDRRREICRELRKARRTMTPSELAATRNKLDSTSRKRWKLTMNPSTSTLHHHNLGGLRK